MLIETISRLTHLPIDRTKKILRFLIVGTTVNLLMILAIIVMKSVGLGYDLALLITNVVGLCINYVLNRSFVFGNSDRVLKTMFLYAMTYASVYVLQLILYRLIFATGIFHEYIAIIATVGLSAIYAYVILEKVVFPDKPDPAVDP